MAQTDVDLLDSLSFDNRWLRELPGDEETDNFRRQVYGACYSRVMPTPVPMPTLLAYSPELMRQLDLPEALAASDAFAQVFAGNALAKGMEPYAMCYGGHQFGHWAGQLGDGRAINLGELVNSRGEHWTLQLKGAGPTPYSRSADGLAVLRSSLREFLCSEAMHHLGVPTTRALGLVATGKQVVRDMFYDGNPQLEPGAIVCRVAPSFTRFGNFQLFAARDDLENLRRLVDFTICNDFPQLGTPSRAVYLQWFEEVCRLTAEMIVHWQRVGFVHGVMNTDNMSILGLTIDYGPYGWLENFDPDWTPNTTDAEGRRYRFGNQPKIGYWNLLQLANALYPLIQRAEPLQQALEAYGRAYDTGWRQMMADKLGLSAFEAPADEVLVADLEKLLRLAEVDMTLFYRGLADFDADSDEQNFLLFLQQAAYLELDEENRQRASDWFEAYRGRLRNNAYPADQRRARMNQVNPVYVLRNYLAQQAIDKLEQGDNSLVNELMTALRQPYSEQPGKEHLTAKRPDWARRRAGCSMLSCSS